MLKEQKTYYDNDKKKLRYHFFLDIITFKMEGIFKRYNEIGESDFLLYIHKGNMMGTSRGPKFVKTYKNGIDHGIEILNYVERKVDRNLDQ